MLVSEAVRVAASLTMILLDPDLAAPETPDGATAHDSPQLARQRRMPSARSLSRFLREAQDAVRLRGAVSVLLTTDAEIRRLNRTFRGKNQVTDVLSFPAASFQQVSGSAGQRVSGAASQHVSGDLAISIETARRQAEAQGHPLAIEVKVLMLHGLLHLAGYDHEIDDGKMERRERVLRARLKLPLGLIERSSVPTLAAKKRRARTGRPDRAPSMVRG
jgi:probable rRNA maturation factor